MTTSQAAVGAGRQAATQAGYPRRWLAAIVMIVGALMDMIDVTIVNVALPTIRRDLHAERHPAGMGGVRVHAGLRGGADHRGEPRRPARAQAHVPVRRRVFGLASLGAGLSGSGAELIAARVVQGAAAAAMAPQVLATFRAIFAGDERGKAFSIYGAMLGFASAVGLLLGGVLTDANLFGWSWRSVFFVNVPVAACRADRRAAVRARDPGPGRAAAGPARARCCWPARWSPSSTRCSRAGSSAGLPGCGRCWRPGVAGLGALGLLEARRAGRPGQDGLAPLLRAGLFRIPAFAAGLGMQLAFSAGLQGFFLACALWLQIGEHFSPLKAGLTAVAFSVGSFIGAPVAVPLAQRHGRRVLASGGAADGGRHRGRALAAAGTSA